MEDSQYFSDARVHAIVQAITAAAWHHRNDETSRELLRSVERIARPMLQHPEAAHGWLRVPSRRIGNLLNLIDPAPTKGRTARPTCSRTLWRPMC